MTYAKSAKGRLIQTFKFLKELNELRNPVQRDLAGVEVLRLDEWPAHPCVQVRRGDREEEDADKTAESEMEPVIRIQRAQRTPCPTPPDILDGWLKPGWQLVEARVGLLESRNFQNDEKQTITIAFTDSPERVTALNAWTVARTAWVDAELPALEAWRVFERIHALWTMMQREGDRLELVLADGILNVAEHSIRYPVLMQRVNLEFEPAVPEFRFNTGTERVELHRALLRLVPSIDGRMIAHFDRELEVQPVEPLGGESTTGFFRRLVQGLFNDGELLEGKAAMASRPSIWREPMIFVRPRTAGLSTTLDFILEDLEGKDAQIPEGLSRIVGVESADEPELLPGSDGETSRTPTGPEPDILFSKPANAEQYEIATRLVKAKAVLVQGPPGTGKTHTIANLKFLGVLGSKWPKFNSLAKK